MKEFISGLGLSEENQKALLERIESRVKEVKESIKNDAEFMKEVRTEAEGKVWNTAERRLKKLGGLKAVELKEAKTFDEVIQLAFNKQSGLKMETLKEMETRLNEAEKEMTRMKEEEIPSIENQYKTDYNNREIEYKVKEMVSTYPTIVEKELIYPSLFAQLNQNYNLKLGESGSLEIYNKDNETKPTLNDKVVGVKEIIEHNIDPFKRKNNASEQTEPLTTQTKRQEKKDTEVKDFYSKMLNNGLV